MTAAATRLAAALAGRYRFDHELGSGGMATVYLADDLRHGRTVAIKVLSSELAHSLGRDRFLREIRLAARLTHPHILPLYDSGEADGVLYYVTPVMKGDTLRTRLQRERVLPVEEALRITSEVADALDYAHRHDVVHRDIKPENILLHEGHAVVADFGIGKAIAAAGSAGETSIAVTQAGVTVGTPAYMSPEQACGADVDGRSDLFSLGCVLYEMLTGQMPFVAESASASLAKRLTEAPPQITAARSEVAAGVTTMVARLLSREASQRPASGAEVITALKAAHTPPASVRTPPGPPAATVKSIAVLPFVNMSADAENEFFSDGLTDEIITDLSGVKALRIISRNSSMQLKGSTKPLPDIGRELGVRYVLTGSVRRAGAALRITAQLVDAERDTPVWADKYAGTIDDVFDVQERVSRAIVSALQVQLTSSEDARLKARRISDGRAFELYLQARNELRRYGASTEGAAELLRRAVDIEGDTPPLRALRAFMEFSKVRAGTSRDNAGLDVAAAEGRALIELDPDAPYGHALLGFVGYERGELPDAARHLMKALELDPTDADVLFFLCVTFQAAGQVEAARRMARRFNEVDPLSPFAGAMLAVGEWFTEHPGRHVDAMERSVAMDPKNPILRWALGYTYALMGRGDDAARCAEWMQSNVPHLPYSAQLLSLVESMAGRADRARQALAQVDVGPLDAHQTFHLSEAFAMAGDAARALVLLEHAVDHGMYPYQFFAGYCPFMAPLRKLPEFERIVNKAARRVADFSVEG